MKESIYGYHDNRKISFLCITMALPKLIAPAKRILEAGFGFAEFPERAYSTYESNIDYEVYSTNVSLSCIRTRSLNVGLTVSLINMQ